MKTTGAWGLDHPEGFPAARDSGLGCAPQPASDCRLHPDTRPTCPLASSREGPPTHAFTHCTALLTARELGPRRTVETFWRSEPTRSLPTWAPRVGGGGSEKWGTGGSQHRQRQRTAGHVGHERRTGRRCCEGHGDASRRRGTGHSWGWALTIVTKGLLLPRTVVEIHPTIHFHPIFYCMYGILQ